MNPVVAALPDEVPFIAPERLEREHAVPITLRLGANESLFGPSPHALDAMEREAGRAALYGDPDCHDLRAELSARLGVPADRLLVGSGIDDLLVLWARVFLQPGDWAVATRGTYPIFAYAVRGAGGQLAEVPYRDDRCDLGSLAREARRRGTRLVYLANPDNPSGSRVDASSLAEFRASLPEDAVLLLDEAYREFAPEDPGGATLAFEDRNVIRLRTFSKAYGLAGLRIGYALATRDAVRAAYRIRLHFGVNRLAQAAAVAAVHDEDHLRSVVRETERAREHLARTLRARGVSVLDSWTNFVLVDLGTASRAEAMRRALLADGCFVRVPMAPPLNRCLRVTVGPRSEMDRFSELLARRLEEIVEH